MSQEPYADEDMKGALAALQRAARRARELARQTGTKIVVVRDGELVKETPVDEKKSESA